MERKEIIISDIIKAAECENLCSKYTVSDKWEIVDYETKDIKGRGILASCRTHPERIEINPNLTGCLVSPNNMSSADLVSIFVNAFLDI